MLLPTMHDDSVSLASLQDGVAAMKAIVSALLALSVLAGIAAPTSALDDNVLGGRSSVEQDRIVY
jgi:hypothetical protein